MSNFLLIDLSVKEKILLIMTAIEKFEAEADERFLSSNMIAPSLHCAIWYLITVSEDFQRILFLGSGDSWDNWTVECNLDRYKHSLRHCLSLVRRTSLDKISMDLPAKVFPKLYEQASQFLFAGGDYSFVSHICGAVHAGNIRITERAGNYVVERVDTSIDERYGVLELMRQSADEPVMPHSSFLWQWMRYEQHIPVAVHQLAQRVRLSKRRIKYEFEPRLSYELSQCLSQLPSVIPPGWQFAWGGQRETTLLLNALAVRVVYHICAVHFGASALGLKGGAEADLCLIIERKQLIHDIAMNSSLDEVRIGSFIDFLTYGKGVDSPDQALQPLIPIGRDRFAIAGIAFLSSNMERNLLSLQARLEPSRFDSQSAIFEVEMTTHLRAAFIQRWERVVSNRSFQLGDSNEEFDLLVCEPASKTLLVLELRWVLSPADPREVQNKSRACHGKVPQAKRKANVASTHLVQLLKVAFGFNIDSSDGWSVFGAVVVEGFGGVRSRDNQVPLIPDWVLKAGVGATTNLHALGTWVRSLDWLPVERRDYELKENTTLLGIEVRYEGIKPSRPGREYLADATHPLVEGWYTTSSDSRLDA